jgi:hypothetical protein
LYKLGLLHQEHHYFDNILEHLVLLDLLQHRLRLHLHLHQMVYNLEQV